jgi:hypothetical protein
VLDTRASALRPVSALISEDLPTLERPAKATSGPRASGSCAIVMAPAKNSHSLANSNRPRSSAAGLKVSSAAGSSAIGLTS